MTSQATQRWVRAALCATLLGGPGVPAGATATEAKGSGSWLDTPRVGFVGRADVSGGLTGMVGRSPGGVGAPVPTASGADHVATGAAPTVFTAARLGYSWDRQWVVGVQGVLGWSDRGFTDPTIAAAVTLSPRATLGFRPRRHADWEFEVGAGYGGLSFARQGPNGAAPGDDTPRVLGSTFNGVATHLGALYRFGYAGLPAALHAYCDAGYYVGFTSDVFILSPRLGLSVGY